ncbi:hypothetical protein PAXINDRAFT_13355 [Paxillus involutus ATCC 200175]|uniref:Uncharacterized protein n=1 Tax=Paxillus involutus ATCC 200175 TaxID=664439 RepID=A0A0C9U2J2_PAXIN|nr:hypothetical protein PAXINDRAFT_13355 [Paxillus involutus ATCC 200175]
MDDDHIRTAASRAPALEGSKSRLLLTIDYLPGGEYQWTISLFIETEPVSLIAGLLDGGRVW